MHAFVFDRIVDGADQVAFRCAKCGREVWFSKAGQGFPATHQENGIWVPEADPSNWVEPCTVEG